MLIGNYYVVYTPGDGLLQFAEIQPRPRDDFEGKYIMFSVKAARDAVIALLPSNYSVDPEMSYYEVIIGAKNNEEIHILKVHGDGSPNDVLNTVSPDMSHGITNHRRLSGLSNSLFWLATKKTPYFCITASMCEEPTSEQWFLLPNGQ